MIIASIDPSPLYYDPVTGKFTPTKPLERDSPKFNKNRPRNESSTSRHSSSYTDEDKKGRRRRRRARGERNNPLATRRNARSPMRNSTSISKANGMVKDLRGVQRPPYHYDRPLNSRSPKFFPSSTSSKLTTCSCDVSIPSSPFSTGNSPLSRRSTETADDVDSPIDSTITLEPDHSASHANFLSDIPSETNITIASDIDGEAVYPSPSSLCNAFSCANQTVSSLALCASSHDSNILSRTAPFVALDMPSEIQLNRLPDDPSSIERILVEHRRSINCFISVAAAYKLKGMLEIAEMIGLAGLRRESGSLGRGAWFDEVRLSSQSGILKQMIIHLLLFPCYCF